MTSLGDAMAQIPAVQEIIRKHGPPPWPDQGTGTATSQTPGSEPLAESNREECQNCGGQGTRPTNSPFGSPGFGRVYTCSQCGGYGSLVVYREHLTLEAEVPFGFMEAGFGNFDPERNPGMRDAYAATQAWADQSGVWTFGCDEMPFLILTGAIGTGKTHLAAAAVNALVAHCQRVRFWSVARLLEDLRETQSSRYDGPPLREVRKAIEDYPWLVLDDLGADRSTEFAAEQLFLIVDHRWSNRLYTLVTTNADPGRIEPRIRSRLMDRQCSTVVACRGKDQRTQRK